MTVTIAMTKMRGDIDIESIRKNTLVNTENKNEQTKMVKGKDIMMMMTMTVDHMAVLIATTTVILTIGISDAVGRHTEILLIEQSAIVIRGIRVVVSMRGTQLVVLGLHHPQLRHNNDNDNGTNQTTVTKNMD